MIQGVCGDGERVGGGVVEWLVECSSKFKTKWYFI